MKRKEMKFKVKTELKALAQEIRELKKSRKGVMNGYVYGLLETSREYREKHVAYCTFFNHTDYDCIETNPTEPLSYNVYAWRIKEWEKEIVNVEIVRASSE